MPVAGLNWAFVKDQVKNLRKRQEGKFPDCKEEKIEKNSKKWLKCPFSEWPWCYQPDPCYVLHWGNKQHNGACITGYSWYHTYSYSMRYPGILIFHSLPVAVIFSLSARCYFFANSYPARCYFFAISFYPCSDFIFSQVQYHTHFISYPVDPCNHCNCIESSTGIYMKNCKNLHFLGVYHYTPYHQWDKWSGMDKG